MQSIVKPIMLMGFKHVGKSTLGKRLANNLRLPFIDLDEETEYLYEKTFDEKYSCREIMHNKGEDFFRLLENKALSSLIDRKPSIVSLSGGAPIDTRNQKLMNGSILIHITAPRNIVFERIVSSGRPAFFNPHEEIVESFNRLWDERENIYKKIKSFTIRNNKSIDDGVDKIIKKLQKNG